jgi:uncharacterized protein YegL
MKPETRRKAQLLIALVIYSVAAVLSYFSVVETGGGEKGGKYDIYLVIDVSWSMNGQKLDAAKEAATAFLRKLDLSSSPDIRVGIITFSTDVDVVEHLTTDENSLISAVQSLTALENTALGDAIKTAADMLIQEGSISSNRTIVAMTDGASNVDQIMLPLDAADYASQNHVVVHSIAFGSDPESLQARPTLQEIARRTGGRYYFATTGTELISVYREIASSFVSPALHYGSRLLILIALPLVLFLPELQKGASTVYKTVLTTVLKKPIGAKSVKCPECGRRNRATARFCGSCRSPMAAIGINCPRCGYINRAEARFCAKCAWRLAKSKEM